MIRRSASRYSQNQEALQQNSFTALKGIDCSKAPTENATVLDAVNLDVDYDGGLVLRKPMEYYRSVAQFTPDVKYMYDKDTLLTYFVNFQGIASPTFYKYKFTDIYGNQYTFDNIGIQFEDVITYNNAKVQNTSTTTLLTNVSVNLPNLEEMILARAKTTVKLYNPNTEPEVQLRMLKLYLDEADVWTFEMLTPEPTVLTTDEISANFNTVNANPLALRDNYFATQTSINGIIAYTDNSEYISNIHSIEKSYTVLKSYAEASDSSFKLQCPNDTLNRAHFNIEFSETTGYMYLIMPNPNAFTEIKVHILDESYDTAQYVQTLTSDDASGIPTDESGIVEVFTLNKNIFRYTITVQCKYKVFSNTLGSSPIDILTESKVSQIVSSVDDHAASVVLKAFLNKPHVPGVLDKDSPTYFTVGIVWERSLDGATWENIVGEPYTIHNVISVARKTSNIESLEESITWELSKCVLLDLPDYKNIRTLMPSGIGYAYPVNTRADCLVVPDIDNGAFNYTYKCTLLKLKPNSGTITEIKDADVVQDYVLDEKLYNFKKSTFETVSNTMDNPLCENVIYWKHRLYAYGETLGSNIYASNVDSAVFPISNIIDLGTYQKGTVRKLIPWRDYLIAFTDNSVHLIQEQEIGFTTKVINTFVGVSELDADTCVSVMNGIIFKSGDKIYTLSPSYNSGVDTILNVSEVSKPIQHLLKKYASKFPSFAFTTSEHYYICMPQGDTTEILKYNYTTKIWTHHRVYKYIGYYAVLDINNIRFFEKLYNGVSTQHYLREYIFEADVDLSKYDNIYGDITGTVSEGHTYTDVTPIRFSLDSGQKTDNISLTKQFVESKMIVATLNSKDNFKMDVRVDIDGNTFKKHIDLNTDGALLRGSADEVLTLGSNTDFDEKVDTFNTLRQMFLRYAGKGKTIRHIISGESLCKFKIYETFYRYKILNVKQ